MKQSLRNKIERATYYDTRNYRYRTNWRKSLKAGHWIIERCPIANLDTTAALGDWEEVK